MRFKILITLLICTNLAIAQNVQVMSFEQVTDSEDGEFFFPQFMPDGKSLIFTKSGYLGIYKMDLSGNEIEELNNQPGAGYNLLVSPNGAHICYHINEYRKGRKYTSLVIQSIRTKENVIIENYTQHQVLPKSLSDNRLVYRKNSQLYTIDVGKAKLNKRESSETKPLVAIEKGTMIIHQNGDKRNLKPLGDGHYIWPSLSPDKNNLLFTKSGDGTYISDLDGNIEFSLGYANASQWSPDGKWICYMIDKDDGHQYLSSEIYISSIDGKNRFRLTEGESIDMYPTWSPAGDKIAFHTNQGKIYLIHLSFEGGDL